ncbi:hypothetical protein COK69_26655, partial [Bacillus cereus]
RGGQQPRAPAESVDRWHVPGHRTHGALGQRRLYRDAQVDERRRVGQAYFDDPALPRQGMAVGAPQRGGTDAAVISCRSGRRLPGVPTPSRPVHS